MKSLKTLLSYLSPISLYWRVRYLISNGYFFLRYHNKPNGIYYDRLTHNYLHPKQLIERSQNLLYVLGEVIQDNPVYTYSVKGEEHHVHSFEQLLLEAYRYKQFFCLLDFTELSQQELDMIIKAQTSNL